jgi:hypothetical protein
MTDGSSWPLDEDRRGAQQRDGQRPSVQFVRRKRTNCPRAIPGRRQQPTRFGSTIVTLQQVALDPTVAVRDKLV